MPDSINAEEYKKAIALLMEARSGQPVSNRMPEHAAALYELFFEKAKQEVVVFCKNLDRKVFQQPGVQNALVKALSRGIRVRVLVQEPPEGPNALTEHCATMALAIDQADPQAAALSYNFSVKDQEAYRFERDRNTTEAFAKMYHLAEAKMLYDRFEALWKNRLVKKF